MAKGTPDDPWIIGDVAEEYAIARRLGVQLLRQGLRFKDGVPHDVLLARDPATGKEREMWFDISRFHGR